MTLPHHHHRHHHRHHYHHRHFTTATVSPRPEVRYDMHHNVGDATLVGAANGGWGLQGTQILLIAVMTMNMFGLCTLSSQIFYMRQALVSCIQHGAA